jgi:DMSO/TMAO reductase YedYZ molybdopterin-dependent catalytic subunit
MSGGRLFSRVLLIIAAIALPCGAQDRTQERIKVDSKTPYGDIIMMDPGRVDASALPLTSVESLHSTGTYQYVEVNAWRLAISGKGIAVPLSLTYEELSALPQVKKRVLLICPETFYDYLEWEGVPLAALLEKAGAGDYKNVVFTSVDGYAVSMKKADARDRFIIVALKGNGVPLPRAHGFPARMVAEGLYGSRWVKYLVSITLE